LEAELGLPSCGLFGGESFYYEKAQFCRLFPRVVFIIQVMPRVMGQGSQRGVSESAFDVERPSDLDGGNWTLTGSLNNARASYTATLLPNGTLLIAGRFDSSAHPFASAELKATTPNKAGGMTISGQCGMTFRFT
jgi:hypothetical protein